MAFGELARIFPTSGNTCINNLPIGLLALRKIECCLVRLGCAVEMQTFLTRHVIVIIPIFLAPGGYFALDC